MLLVTPLHVVLGLVVWLSFFVIGYLYLVCSAQSVGYLHEWSHVSG